VLSTPGCMAGSRESPRSEEKSWAVGMVVQMTNRGVHGNGNSYPRGIPMGIHNSCIEMGVVLGY